MAIKLTSRSRSYQSGAADGALLAVNGKPIPCPTSTRALPIGPGKDQRGATDKKDPATYAGVGVAMLIAALAASIIPALRAQQDDPNAALRCE